MNPIVGIGELLWDVYSDGRKVAGGAPFNFAFHCHQLGHPAIIVSRVGDDDLGRELRECVRELGLSDAHIQPDRKLPTGTVRVTVDKVGQPTYSIAANVAWDNLEWTDAVAELTRTTAAICHGTLALRAKASRAVVDKLAYRIGQHGGLTVYDVNLRNNDPDEKAVFRSKWLKVNADELGPLMRRVGESIDDGVSVPDVPAMLEYLRIDTKRDDTAVILTRGEDGAEIYTHGFHHRQRAVPVKVVDTVGAGDAFTAAMVCLHLEGRPLAECAKFAVHYAARVCEQPGGTPRIDRREVEQSVFGYS